MEVVILETLIIFLIGFPFLSALILSIINNNNFRKIITYISSAAIIGVALALAFNYFSVGKMQLSYFSQTETADPVMVVVEIFLTALITVLSIKYRKYYAALLSILQTGLTLVYELGGYAPQLEVRKVYIDQLTVIMVLIIAVVGTLITIYANGYMRDYHKHHTEAKDRRPFFFAMLYVFIGAMFGLVFSNSLLWIYFFWEITSVVSFLLIGYTKTEEAIHNCFRALWMNLLGGLAFAAAIVWSGMEFYITDLQSLILSDETIVIVIVILLSFAALTKSAQLPFSRWLLEAMVAPTPSSALLHSATMVKAGVYLLLRLAPVLSGTGAGIVVSLMGGFTFLVASMLAITVSDAKKVLAYSTISNLGLITACAGVGVEETVWAGIFLLIFHAVSKSLLFQTVGAIENATGSREIESMHGLIKRHPKLALTLVTGICGMFLAPFGMLISKWAALTAFIDSSGVSILLVLLICFGSATTFVYWTKWLGTVLASRRNDRHAKKTTTTDQWISLRIHSLLMVLLCFLFPLISKFAVGPYVNQVFYTDKQVISSENIIMMILLVAFVFIIPTICFFLAKKTHFQRADRYMNGVNAGDQENFYDSFGEKKKMMLTNWYLDDIFGEKKLWKLSIITSTVFILGFLVIAIGGAF